MTQRIVRSKPEKPSPTFPLTAHAGGAWCKKIRGRLFYFGRWSDPEAALREYLSIADSLQVGIDPRKQAAGALDLAGLCNRFLHSQRLRVDSGDIRPRTWRERRDLCSRMLEILGRTTPVSSLGPEQFQLLRSKLAETLGPVALKNAIVRIKSVFNWADECDLLKTPVRFGPDFRPPSLSVIRIHKNQAPKRFFEAAEVRRIIEAASPTMRAMVLLAVNGGLGNTDLAALTTSHVSSESKWLDFPRIKTGIRRRFPLWNETADALREAAKCRPKTDRPEFFLTRQGNPWVRETDDGKTNDEVSKSFRKLLKRLGLNKSGRAFYSLRHTFRTIADGTGDIRAIECVMGHGSDPQDMGAIYVEVIDDRWLLAVTETVRRWLFDGKEVEGAEPSAE